MVKDSIVGNDMTNIRGLWPCKYSKYGCNKEFQTFQMAQTHEKNCPKKPKKGK